MRFHTDLATLEREVVKQTFRGRGPGGQHRNKVESGIRLVHIPSGISAVATEHRFQGRNLALALQRLRDKLIVKNAKQKPRRATRPSRGSVERRLDRKRRQAQRKSLRRRMFP